MLPEFLRCCALDANVGALPLPPAKFVGVPAGTLRRKSYQFQQFIHALTASLFVEQFVDNHGFAQHGEHRHTRIER